MYISFLPQFAEKLKSEGKGIIFYNNNFILGIIGNNTAGDMVKELEALCKEMSKKQVKSNVKKETKFDYKIKGQKPVVTKDIIQFNIFGGDFVGSKIAEVLKKHGALEMD